MITLILLAVALSMDAFSLCISMGTLNIKIKKMIIFTITIGIFHFIMPLFGMILGDFILKIIAINLKYVTSAIFFILGIFILFEKDENDKISSNYITLLFLAFLVSIDSFMAGIGINAIENRHILSCSTFSIFSITFSLIGLFFGRYIKLKIGNKSKIFAALILILMSIRYLTNL